MPLTRYSRAFVNGWKNVEMQKRASRLFTYSRKSVHSKLNINGERARVLYLARIALRPTNNATEIRSASIGRLESN